MSFGQHHSSFSQTAGPPPMSARLDVEHAQQRRWVRVCMFPRSGLARLRYVPLRTSNSRHAREEAVIQDIWTCRTALRISEVARVKYTWETNWDYYEIKFAIPLIPGFGRGNAALMRLQYCPEFVGEVIVMRRTGPRLSVVADMRIEDRRKAEVATISIRTAMGLDGTYRGNIVVQFMLSLDALDSL